MKVEKFLEKLFEDGYDCYLDAGGDFLFIESGWREKKALQKKFDSLIKELK